MGLQTSKTESPDSLLIEARNGAELRAQRVWRLVIVMLGTWLFFTAFLWSRGYGTAAWVCLLDSLAHVFVIGACRQMRSFRLIMNLSLAASAVGLFSVSISHPAMAFTMLFFPVSILVASQLLGVRDAACWFVVNAVAFVLYQWTIYGNAGVAGTEHLDELILLIGVAATTFFCCQQGEQFYQERTRDLVTLSHGLRKKSEWLQRLATTDSLTGLMNRHHFLTRLEAAIEKAHRSSNRFALFLIDMDGFKEVNDTLGHPIGDEALVEVATRLREEIGEAGDIARLGGDEFCVIYPDVAGHDEACQIAKRLGDALKRRYVLQQHQFSMGSSVGYAIYPDHAQTQQEMLAYSDTAMFHAKEKQLGHACYDPEMTNQLVETRRLQERLSVALERDEFFLLYQPKVDIETGAINHVEALIRWRHDGEVIPPFKFIPLLEQSGEIVPVSDWIAREACQQIARWGRLGFRVGVSINVSAVQFKDPHFCENLEESIRDAGIDPTLLECEITEGLLIDDIQQATNRLHQAKDIGLKISIDDFGTGYSSLAYLRQFPLDTLKIDRAFIKDIPDEDDGMIASSIIVLAKALGLNVIAEGVESEEHLSFLKYQDCDEYQGYLMSPPVSAEKITELLLANPHTPQTAPMASQPVRETESGLLLIN